MFEISLLVLAPVALVVTGGLLALLLPSSSALARDLGLPDGELPSVRGHRLEGGSSSLLSPTSGSLVHSARL
jgi:hypothetical protein